ncbi:unnamed protein product, partial [Mesorhabditis spiculigera]
MVRVGKLPMPKRKSLLGFFQKGERRQRDRLDEQILALAQQQNTLELIAKRSNNPNVTDLEEFYDAEEEFIKSTPRRRDEDLVIAGGSPEASTSQMARLKTSFEWDAANAKKVEIEEKQRVRRRQAEVEAARVAKEGKEVPEVKPLWFDKLLDPDTKLPVYISNGDYWKCKDRQDWSRCPDLF